MNNNPQAKENMQTEASRPPMKQLTQDSNVPGKPFKPAHILAGFALVMLFGTSLSLWSSLAPIESAIVSPGIIQVAGYRKEIQHLEGGIVDSIHVNDGQKVSSGDVLVKLKDIQPLTELKQLQGRLVEVESVVARLQAERENLEAPEFPESLAAKAHDPAVSSIMKGQVGILESHKRLWEDKHAVLENKISQTQQEIRGLEGQAVAKRQQREFIQRELDSIQEALSQFLVPKSEGLKLQQRLAETRGELIALQAEIGRLKQAILEMRLQMSEAEAERLASISEDLRRNKALRYDLTQRILAAEDVLQRTEIVSPIDGIVVNLQVHSNQGVVDAGAPLMEVVPVNDELIVEARVAPRDIDEIWAGMPADVRLTSLSRRQRIPLEGTLVSVSADRLRDDYSGEEYYKAQVSLSAEVIQSSSVNLVAGMGADVFFQTGSRTALDYLLSPITKSLIMGLREQ